MKISTRGRYALRIMIDLAEHGGGEYIPLKDVVERQEISKKYAESIMIELSKSGLVDAAHGKGGGYRLKRPADEYTVLEILKVTEGELTIVDCNPQGIACPRASTCRTTALWKELGALVEGFLNDKKLSDYVQRGEEYDFVI